MIRHCEISDKLLWTELKSGRIQFGGNVKLKIFGTLKCQSGKRMKRANRVFFETTLDAIEAGYRPCGHCMKEEYRKWISLNNM